MWTPSALWRSAKRESGTRTRKIAAKRHKRAKWSDPFALLWLLFPEVPSQVFQNGNKVLVRDHQALILHGVECVSPIFGSGKVLPHAFEIVTHRAFVQDDLFTCTFRQWAEIVLQVVGEHRNVGCIDLRAFFNHRVDYLC